MTVKAGTQERGMERRTEVRRSNLVYAKHHDSSYEASGSCHEVIIYLTRVNQENDHTSMVVYHS